MGTTAFIKRVFGAKIESAPEPALHSAACDVLRDWAGLQAEAAGQPARKPQHGMLCLAVGLGGGAYGMVSVAAEHRLGAALAVAATGDPGAGSFSAEALQELCLQLKGRLRARTPGGDLELRPQ